MVRYLAAIACLAILGVSAAASFADLRPDVSRAALEWDRVVTTVERAI